MILQPPREFLIDYYCPTTNRAEGIAPYRMKNFVIRSRGRKLYAEVYSGSENLSETIASTALTGTLAITSGSKVVTGTGTSFLAELHLGQKILFYDTVTPASYLLVVETITDDTHFTMSKAATASVSGKTGYQMARMFEINKQRGTLLCGNAMMLDKGNILAVGSGVLRLNGAVLPGSSLTASRSPKIAIVDSATGNYSVYTLGMATPAAITITNVAGGTKNMQPGSYCVVLAPAKTATNGYNNPSKVPTAATLAAGERVQVTAPAMDTTNGEDAWRAYGTLYATNTLGIATVQNGPFRFIRTVTTAEVSSAGGTFNLEWVDAEISTNELLTFNNDPPPNAEFVSDIAQYPIWISCQGKIPTGTSISSPGPYILPAKPNNIEAVPLGQPPYGLSVSTSPPETIIGCVPALGRLFLLTQASLQVGQTTGQAAVPLTARPFWKSTGFTNPDQLLFANDTLYGYPGSGPTRSSADGEEVVVQKEFAADMQEIIATWIHGQVMVAHDPKNDAICFIHSADSLNSSGYWTTRVLMYGLRQQALIGDVVLESTTQDMIVSGVATVGSNLDFLAGGRTAAATVSVGTYRFDTGSGVAISSYLAWAFNGNGMDCLIKAVSVTGKLTNPTIGIFGAGATEVISTTVLEAGNSGSKSESVALSTTTDVTQSQRIPLNVPNLSEFTMRIDTNWAGSGAKDRIDKAELEYAISVMRR